MFARLNLSELVLLDRLQALLQNRVLDVLMPAVSFLGNAGWIWILTGLVLLCLRRHRRTGAILLAALLLGFLIGNVALKLFVARERPCWINGAYPLLINSPTDYSFPSGHTLSSAAAATVLMLRDRRFGAIAVPTAVLIAFSRLYLYVHFPTDVLTGAVLGVLIGILVTVIAGRLAVRRRIPDERGKTES